MQCILNGDSDGKRPQQPALLYDFKMHSIQQATKLFTIRLQN